MPYKALVWSCEEYTCSNYIQQMLYLSKLEKERNIQTMTWKLSYVSKCIRVEMLNEETKLLVFIEIASRGKHVICRISLHLSSEGKQDLSVLKGVSIQMELSWGTSLIGPVLQAEANKSQRPFNLWNGSLCINERIAGKNLQWEKTNKQIRHLLASLYKAAWSASLEWEFSQ